MDGVYRRIVQGINSEVFQRYIRVVEHFELPKEIAQAEPDFSREITHPSPMTSQQIKNSIETRSSENQDIKFLEKKECVVCLRSWRDILVDEDHLVFLKCGHVYCRQCAVKLSSQGWRVCSLCRNEIGSNPPFRRLHVPLDPRLKKNRCREN